MKTFTKAEYELILAGLSDFADKIELIRDQTHQKYGIGPAYQQWCDKFLQVEDLRKKTTLLLESKEPLAIGDKVKTTLIGKDDEEIEIIGIIYNLDDTHIFIDSSSHLSTHLLNDVTKIT